MERVLPTCQHDGYFIHFSWKALNENILIYSEPIGNFMRVIRPSRRLKRRKIVELKLHTALILNWAETSMISTEQVELIKAKYEALKAELDERSRRLWSAVEANSLGYGGIVAVSQATGLSESTIRLGQQELKGQLGSVGTIQERRIRRQGGGRKSLLQEDSEILEAL
jgi:hypothetical protein